jgi:hypothetical protein
MIVSSPREREGIYRGIFLVSESVPAWIRGFGVATFRLGFSGFAALRGRWYSGYYI